METDTVDPTLDPALPRYTKGVHWMLDTRNGLDRLLVPTPSGSGRCMYCDTITTHVCPGNCRERMCLSCARSEDMCSPCKADLYDPAWWSADAD